MSIRILVVAVLHGHNAQSGQGRHGVVARRKDKARNGGLNFIQISDHGNIGSPGKRYREEDGESLGSVGKTDPTAFWFFIVVVVVAAAIIIIRRCQSSLGFLGSRKDSGRWSYTDTYSRGTPVTVEGRM